MVNGVVTSSWPWIASQRQTQRSQSFWFSSRRPTLNISQTHTHSSSGSWTSWAHPGPCPAAHWWGGDFELLYCPPGAPAPSELSPSPDTESRLQAADKHRKWRCSKKCNIFPNTKYKLIFFSSHMKSLKFKTLILVSFYFVYPTNVMFLTISGLSD